MPRNQFQRMVFAFLTVVITAHAYVFYSLYVVNGSTLTEINNASGVIEAINNQGGIYMFGKCFRYGQSFLLNLPVHMYLRSLWEALIFQACIKNF